jgi:hypothetical protein
MCTNIQALETQDDVDSNQIIEHCKGRSYVGLDYNQASLYTSGVETQMGKVGREYLAHSVSIETLD